MNEVKETIIERIRKRHPAFAKSKSVGVSLPGAVPTAIKTTKDNKRNVLVTANTTGVDCDSEVVLPYGAQLGYFGLNRRVFVDHDYKFWDMCGGVRTGWPTMVNGAWDVLFATRRSAVGDQVLKDAEDFGISVSIGFDAIDVGPPTPEEVEKYGGGESFRSIVRQWEWIELSVTYMPCLVHARQPHAVGFEPAPVAGKTVTVTPFGVSVTQSVA